MDAGPEDFGGEDFPSAPVDGVHPVASVPDSAPPSPPSAPDEGLKRIADAAFDQIADEIAAFADWAKSPDVKVTRAMIVERLGGLKEVAKIAIGVLLKDAGKRADAMAVEKVEEAEDKRDEAISAMEKMEIRFGTMRTILERDARIFMPDVDEASRHADPVGYLKKERQRRIA